MKPQTNEHKSTCRFPGCKRAVTKSNYYYGYCCALHYNQHRRILKGDYTMDDLKFECAIDGFKFHKEQCVAKHLRDCYGYTDEQLEEYYRKYILKPGMPDGKCKYCGAPVKFKGLAKGYDSFCHNKDCNVRWYNENTDRLEKAAAGIRETHSQGDVIPSQIGYWLKKGFTKEEAQEKVRERQTTNSVESIMKREGCSLEDAEAIRRSITSKWLKSRAAQNRE